jgi:hypothetical protein
MILLLQSRKADTPWDAELDAFVDALAIRIASFGKQAIAERCNR